MPKPLAITTLIQQLPYFAGLSSAQAERLSQQATRRTFTAGEMLFSEGETAAGLWVIETGSVKIFKSSREGREHVLRFFGPGDGFNEILPPDSSHRPDIYR